MITAAEQTQSSCRMFYVDGKKFKTNAYLGFFRIPLRRENATKIALLAEILKSGTKSAPSRMELERTAEEMYGALWDVQVVKKGNEAWLSFSLEVLKHVPEEDALTFLRSLMREPKMDGWTFPEDVVKRKKEILRRRLEAQADEKRLSARKRCLELTAAGSGAGVWADGYAEDLMELTAEEMTCFYREIWMYAPLSLFFCGESEGRKCLKEWKKVLDLQRKKLWECPPLHISKAEVRTVREQSQMTQTRVALGFVSGCTLRSSACLAVRVLCELLGGANGVLFQEIRERQGLCYDISVSYDATSGMVMAETGVQPQQAKHAVKEILRFFQEMGSQNIQEADFRSAVEQIGRQYANISDDPWKILNFVAEQEILGNGMDTEQILRQLRFLEPEDVQKAAKQLALRTVYLLSNEEADTWD